MCWGLTAGGMADMPDSRDGGGREAANYVPALLQQILEQGTTCSSFPHQTVDWVVVRPSLSVAEMVALDGNFVWRRKVAGKQGRNLGRALNLIGQNSPQGFALWLCRSRPVVCLQYRGSCTS